MCEVLDRIENRGLEKGMMTTLASLVRDGLITVQEAAKRSHLTVTEFETRAKELQLQ